MINLFVGKIAIFEVPGVNIINILQAAFMPADSKCAKR
jgi:hypothetical protein